MTLDDVENVHAQGLPRAVVDALRANFVLYTTKVRHESRSGDGTTTKMIVELAAGTRGGVRDATRQGTDDAVRELAGRM